MIIPAVTLETLEKRPLSYSSLKAFRKSPKHFIQYITAPKEATPAMVQGKVIDCLALEPEKFAERFMVIGKINKATNDGKKAWNDAITKANELRLIIITQEDLTLARKSVEALMSLEFSRRLLEGKRAVQLKLKWNDRATGLPINGVIDFDSKVGSQDFIVDLKSAVSADPDDFSKQAYNLDYHLQCGTYSEGYPRVRFKFPNFAFLVVEKDEPFNVSVNFCDTTFINEAKEEFRATLGAFKYCMDNSLFHQGYEFRKFGTMDYFSMSLPKYAKHKFQVNEN
jgi:hypothetical protein